MGEQKDIYSRHVVNILVSLTLVLSFGPSGFASNAREKTLYTFQGNSGTVIDGSIPTGGLIADTSGNLYGTTISGGADTACSCGTVFQLSPPLSPGGAWTETVLHSFSGSDTDGASPFFSTLLLDKFGNLYGTTQSGGHAGAGTIFKLSPPTTAGAAWTETILYTFNSPYKHAGFPGPSLAMDESGNLYGTTEEGGGGTHCPHGANDCGVVFKLRAPGSPGGTWILSVISSFGVSSNDLGTPSNLVLHNGVFYGTANTPDGTGAVFQLANHHGVWTRTTLHEFSLDTVELPGSLTLDPAGNIFGTAGSKGGACVNACGAVFELSPPVGSVASWSEVTLYVFTGGNDGAEPEGHLVFDKAGNLYGTAAWGGLEKNGIRQNGTIFELSPPAVFGSPWSETTLYQFGSKPGDELQPVSGLLLLKGKFYGTTTGGSLFEGFNESGTVFSLTLVP